MKARTTLRALASRWPQVTSLLLLAAVTLGAVNTVVMVDAATRAAVSDSVDGRVVEGRYAVQALTEKGAKLVRGNDALVPVGTRDVEVRTGGGTDARLGTAAARTSPEVLPPAGVLLTGAGSTGPDEVTLSRGLAEGLGAEVGSTVELDGRAVRVVGLTVDPMDRDALTLSATGPVAPDEADFWLAGAGDVPDAWSDHVTMASPEVQRVLARQGVRDRGGLPATAAWVAALMGAAAIASLLASISRGARADLLAMEQAGASPRRLGRWLAVMAAVLLTMGGVLGWLVSAVAVRGAAEPLSALWSQYWVDVPSPATTAVWLLALVVVPLGLLVAARRVSTTAGVPTRRGTQVFVALVVGALVVRTATVVAEFGVAQSAPLLGLVVSVVLSVVVSVVLSRVRRDAVGQLTSYAARGLVALSVILASVVFLGMFRAGWSWHVDEKYERFPIAQSGQEGGSMVVTGLTPVAVSPLLDRYGSLGGSTDMAVVAEDVDASKHWYEVVSPRLAECVLEDPTIDPGDPPQGCSDASSLGTVYNLGLDPRLEGDAARAAPEVFVDGRVGLVRTPGDGSDEPAEDRRAYLLDAVEDPALGLQMPGLVVGPDHPLIAELGITGQGLNAVYLPDFASLDTVAQARFRAAAQSAAPTSTLTQSPLGDGGVPGTVQVWAFGGSAALLLVGTLVLVGFHSSFAWLRALMVSLGASRRRRVRVSAAVFAGPLLTTLGATVTAYVLLKVAAHGVPVGFGPYMWLPVVVAVAMLGVATVAFAGGGADTRD